MDRYFPQARLYLTYEELKLFLLPQLFWTIRRLYLTYEELKPLLTWTTEPSSVLSLYLTYEELKHPPNFDGFSVPAMFISYL